MKTRNKIVAAIEEEMASIKDRVMSDLNDRVRGIERVTVIIPLPPRILSPNCPVASFRGRMMRAAAAKKQKRLAKESAEDAMRGARWEKASVKAVFYHKAKRRRDDVNALAMLKSAYDGVIEAELLPDDDRDHLRTEGAEFRIDKEWPRVELIFTREG